MRNGFVGISTDRYNRGPVKAAPRQPFPQAMPSALGRGAAGGDRPTAPGCGAARRLTFCPWLHHSQGGVRPPLAVPQSRDCPYFHQTTQTKNKKTPSPPTKRAPQATPAGAKTPPGGPPSRCEDPGQGGCNDTQGQRGGPGGAASRFAGTRAHDSAFRTT